MPFVHVYIFQYKNYSLEKKLTRNFLIMQNIITARQVVLENINIGSLIEQFNPSSMQGSSLKKNLSEAFNAGHLQKVSSMIDVIAECNTICNVDTASYAMVEKLSEKLNESIKTKLIFCFESIDNYRSNVLHESLKNVLNELVVLEDAEIVTKIRAGALSPYKVFESVHFIIESVHIKSDVVSETETHKAYHPVSYTEISENRTAFIRLHNQVFAINENKLFQTNSPSPKFAFLSSIVENLTFDHTNESFGVEHALLGKFEIFENKITRQAVGSEEILEHVSTNDLRSDVTMIIESAGASNDRASRQQVDENKKFIDAISAVYENFESISIADNIVIVENSRQNEKFAIITNENAAHVITLKSNRMPNIIESFKDVRSALLVLEKKSGYDAKHFFTNELVQIQENDASTKENIGALNSVIESLEEKANEIQTLIKEAKAEPVINVGKIEKLNEAFKLNEAHIFEQRTNLSELLS